MTAAPEPENVLSHWSTLIEGFQTSPLGFFQAVEAALQRRQIPDSKNTRVDYHEGGALSAKREYLHVTREKLVFDVSAAPFGAGFFVSWWFAEERLRLNPLIRLLILLGMLAFVGWILYQLGLTGGLVTLAIITGGTLVGLNQAIENGQVEYGLVRAIPVIGALYNWLFKPETYYRIDKMEMFQNAVHNAVLEVIDDMITSKGLRALSEADRKPVMRDFYKTL